MKSKLEILNEILSQKQHKKVKCRNQRVLLDQTTALLILQIYDRLKVKFMLWDWDRLASFAWSKAKLRVHLS